MPYIVYESSRLIGRVLLQHPLNKNNRKRGNEAKEILDKTEVRAQWYKSTYCVKGKVSLW